MALGYAALFPGQGSQALGMLGDLAREWPVVEETFAEASEVLGYDLWRLCQEGPEAALNQTERTQPAMLCAGVATWRVWTAAGGAAPTHMAGHSLGEYTALVCAGSLEFPDAVRLVATRGRLMQEAVPEGEGAVAAILGLADAEVEAACAEAARGEVVRPVNFNAPGQVVIAGHRPAVERAMASASARGAKKVVRLPLSVPVHSPLMEPAARRYREALESVIFREPTLPIPSNVDLEPHRSPARMRENLALQLHHPVRWTETVLALEQAGVPAAVELGPGRVLAGLNRRIARGMKIAPVHDPASLEKALALVSDPA